MSEELRLAYARMSREIDALTTECDIALQDANVVRAYLQQEEPGVALEHLCDTLIETGAPLKEQQLRRLLDVAKEMGLIQRAAKDWFWRMETLLAQVS